MRRSLATLTVLTCIPAVGTACGADETTSDTSDPGDTQTINITFSGDSVTPSGERVEVESGRPIELVVKADEPGEIHVHSDPEQELEYATGTTTLMMAPLDRPGVVEVESHDLEQVVVQLEVK